MQLFKGDALELQVIAAGERPFDICSASLQQFYEGCFNADDWLLALYDNGRMPFSDRVPRDSFVSFIKEAIENFPVTGTFEAYLFILKSIFGQETEVLFEVPEPGVLEMIVNAQAALIFEMEGREFSGGSYSSFEVTTSDGDIIAFSGLSGIDSEAELNQLLSELIPAGIYPDITLAFFTMSFFVAEEAGDFSDVVDHLGNQIAFFET